MAALSYLLLPASGLVVFLVTDDRRARFHGLQSIALGLLWPLMLYAAAALSPLLTRLVWGGGAITWVVLLVATAAGRNPRLPGLGGTLWRAASRGES